jgi:Flp pilus assembly protein TadG
MMDMPSSKELEPPSSKGRKQQGQSIVEMAIILPVLALILVAVVDASRAFDAYIVLTNAAREGARFASLQPAPNDGLIELLVINDVVGSGTNVTQMHDFDSSNIQIQRGATGVTVTLTYEFDLWFGGLVGINAFPLEKTSAMPKYLPDT